MKDRNGKTLRVGDLVAYHVDGRVRGEPEALRIVAISNDIKYIKTWKAHSMDQPPYALLEKTEDEYNERKLEAPFFSIELRKLEIEDLI